MGLVLSPIEHSGEGWLRTGMGLVLSPIEHYG